MPKESRRRKKDPRKPKRGKSAFLLFSQYTRPTVVAEMPDLAFPDIAREVARRWKLIDGDEKAKLEKAAQADRERYNEEMKTYVPPPDAEEGGGKRRRRKQKKEGPKRNVSSFMWFCKENRGLAKQENPGASMTGISSILGQKWNLMDAEAREPFEKLARADKERYLRESKLFQETKAKAMAELATKQAEDAEYDDLGGEMDDEYDTMHSNVDVDYDVVW